ncbi:MAG: DinB family protein [Candidatus Cyclobacteriaceae bacterium M3_2C_046]
MEQDLALRKHLTGLLHWSSAHVTFDEVFEGIPLELTGRKPASLPYNLWQLLEHLRIAQWDILQFSKDADHVSLHWPDEYWPVLEKPGSEQDWALAVSRFKQDRNEMVSLIKDPKTDLFKPISGGEGQNLLREVLLVTDHNAYHVGQAVLVRKFLGIWR